jgi:hypothetical protein
VDDDEECDDGIANSNALPDRCRTDCTLPSCGDGVIDVGDGEQCEPPGTIACDSSCHFRLILDPPAAPFLPLASGTNVAPAAVERGQGLAVCQRTLLRTGRRLFDRSQRAVSGCVAGLASCATVLDGSAACGADAVAACTDAARDRGSLVADAVTDALRACAGVPVGSLLAPGTGLGFAGMDTCPLAGDAAPRAADVIACAYRAVECAGEATVARIMPSAYGLLDGAALDPDTAFPCVTDPFATP